MEIRTKTHVNARTQDGRVYAAGEGTVTVVDDDDAGMVGLMRSLFGSGQIEILGDGGTVEETTADSDSSDDPEVDPEIELTQMREQAEAVGVKVDKRWGADRLREEIAAVQAAGEGDE